MSVEPLALQPPVSNNLGERVDSIKTTIHERLDRVRAFFKPNEQEARELLERVAMRIETREREDRVRGIYGPSEGDLDPEVLDRMHTLYGVHVNLAQHEFSRAGHTNLVGVDNEPYGKITGKQKLVYLAALGGVAAGIGAPFLPDHNTPTIDRESITSLTGPLSDNAKPIDGMFPHQIEASYDLRLGFPSENPVDIEVVNPGACEVTLYEASDGYWIPVGNLSTDADVMRLVDVPNTMALGSENCNPSPDFPFSLHQIEDGFSIHMATLLTAIEYTSPDPNNILEAREINGGEGIKVAVVDLYFPEFLDMRVADFANTDIEVSSDNLPSVDSASTVFGANNSMHGTVVASRVGGQIGGAAPHVAISAIGIGAESVVDGSSGSFTVDVEARINAMESVMESSDIIVVSLASTEVSEIERVAYTRLFAEGKAKGKFFVLGAGNEARHLNSEMQAVGRLAENSHVLVVGGTDTTGEITTLAGEVYAHDGGDSIVPLWTSGWVPTDSDSGNKFVNDNYTQLVEGGSSFSAPVVAGVLANMLAMDPSLRQRPEDVERILKDTSGDFGIDAVAALRLTYREMLAKHPKMPFRGR